MRREEEEEQRTAAALQPRIETQEGILTALPFCFVALVKRSLLRWPTTAPLQAFAVVLALAAQLNFLPFARLVYYSDVKF